MIKLDLTYADGDIDTQLDTTAIRSIIESTRTDAFGGFLDLPTEYDKEEFARIKETAAKIQSDSNYLVCIGIGGSYLGARAVIDALEQSGPTTILYIGNSLSTFELERVIQIVAGHDWSINVISKSGTTTEPAIAFRVLRQKLIEQYGEQVAYARIYATTDAHGGALHDEAVANNYAQFVVPDNIGGRYSVLTAVGLLPIAVAGADIDELIQGAADEAKFLLDNNGGDAAKYASVRNQLYMAGKHTEVLANFEPSYLYFNEWFKQLAGESEGKDQKGLFPASVIYTTDLHSMGQYMQQGSREIFETILDYESDSAISDAHITIPEVANSADGLDYLAGKTIEFVNDRARLATFRAHTAGGLNVLRIVSPDYSAHSLGGLIYFFMLSIAISGKLLGVDPFNQPGVEHYKKEMFHLLGKPGF
jgi:glucose-6-phosphate isomerase